MSDLVQTYQGAVYPWHCDHVGHMNVMWYVGKFDEATWNLMAMLGLSGAWLRENARGMAAVDQHLQYRKELHAGDVVIIRSGILEMREKSMRFFHEMQNGVNGEVCALSRFVAVHMDTAARKSCAFPPAAIERGKTLLREYDFDER